MRLLLLTLYYPPLNTIAALRLKAFERHLTKEGHVVDVITRFYDLRQQKGETMFLGSEAAEDFTEDYIRQDQTIYTNFSEKNEKRSFSQKLPPLLKGLYNYWHTDIFHYGWSHYVMQAFEKELVNNKYDYIIASYGPPITMVLAKRLSEIYSIPYLIDFRDNFIDERDVSYQLFMKKIVQQRQLSAASGLVFATKGMQEFFTRNANKKLKKIPSCVVYNGVDEMDETASFDPRDEAVVKHFDDLKIKCSFLLLHTGTLYSGQNSSFFLHGVEAFNKQNKTSGIIVFLGLAENKTTNSLNYPFVHLLPKVQHVTAMYLQKRASALLLPIWDGRYTGFSGKTLEYIFSGNFIITSPKPQNDLNEFFDISPNVFIPENATAFEKILADFNSGSVLRQELKNKEKLYRSFWVKKLIQFLEQLNTLI